MTTMTISYDEKNAQIIELIRKLIAAEEEEKQAFLCTSKANASRMFSKYLV